MRSLLAFFGLNDSAADEHAGDTATVRRIVAELEGLDAERARKIAAFAFLLGRVANADLEISDAESETMERLVREVGGLEEDQAILVVQIAKAQNRLFGGTESFQVAREYRQLASKDERERLLHCLFAVSAADDSISGVEETQVRLVAEELGFSHREMIDIRSLYNDQRTVVKRLRDRQ